MPHRGRARFAVMLFLTALLLWAGGSASAQRGALSSATRGGTNNATFGIGPANPKGLDARPFLNYLVTPAANSTDYVAVENIGVTQLSLGVYAIDAVNGTNGQPDLPPRAVKPTDAGTWIRLPAAAATVTVAPRTTVVVPFAVMVPPSASPGDHAAAIVASLQTTARNPQGELVHVEQRVATRAFFRVGGPLRPSLSIEDVRAAYHQNWIPGAPGSVTLSYTIHNTGNLKLGARQSASVSGLFGQRKLARDLASFQLLMPGAQTHVAVRLKGVFPELLGTAHLVVTPLPVLGDADPALSTAKGSKHLFMLPLTLLLILVLGGAYLWRRRQTPPARAGDDTSGSGSEATVGHEALS